MDVTFLMDLDFLMNLCLLGIALGVFILVVSYSKNTLNPTWDPQGWDAFDQFIEGMHQEYLRHHVKRGDYWMSCDIQGLKRDLAGAIKDLDVEAWALITPEATTYLNFDHLSDIALFCGFLYLRLTWLKIEMALTKEGEL